MQREDPLPTAPCSLNSTLPLRLLVHSPATDHTNPPVCPRIAVLLVRQNAYGTGSYRCTCKDGWANAGTSCVKLSKRR